MPRTRTTEALFQSGHSGETPSQTSLNEDCRKVQIEVPLSKQPPPTEFVLHVDCKLTPQQSTVARRIAQQLDFQNATLDNGQRIVNVHGALKWLLEQIAKQPELTIPRPFLSGAGSKLVSPVKNEPASAADR